MSRKDYRQLARIVGNTLGAAYVAGGEDARTIAYDQLYRPLVTMLADDNPRFSPLTFASAVGDAEASYCDSETGRVAS